MTKARRTIRVEECDWARWSEAAKIAGLTQSEWMRRKLNEVSGMDLAVNPKDWEPKKRGARIPKFDRVEDVGVEEGEHLVGGGPAAIEREHFTRPSNPEHDKTCQCGVCQFRRKMMGER